MRLPLGLHSIEVGQCPVRGSAQTSQSLPIALVVSGEAYSKFSVFPSLSQLLILSSTELESLGRPCVCTWPPILPGMCGTSLALFQEFLVNFSRVCHPPQAFSFLVLSSLLFLQTMPLNKSFSPFPAEQAQQ